MHLGELINKYRKSNKMTMEAFAEKSGLSKGYISMLEKNQNPASGNPIAPSVQVIKQVSDAIGMDFNDVMNSLDDDYIVSLNDGTIIKDLPPLSKKEQILSKFKLYENPISAGLGSWLDEGTEYNYIEIEHPPVSADFALKVRGDSMSPMYNDGDIVFVKSHTLVEPGQVGVFLINGEGYLKQWQGNRLLSLNKDYDPIYVEEEDQFMIVGKVVDKLTK